MYRHGCSAPDRRAASRWKFSFLITGGTELSATVEAAAGAVNQAFDLKEKPLALQPIIEVGHELAVAVPFQGRPPLVGAEHPLGRLTPAWVRHLRVDIGPKAVLAALYRLPERHRPFVGERETHNRFDGFEPVFPRQRQAQWRPVLLGNGLAVHPGDQKGEFVTRLGDREPLDIGPGIP